LQILIFNLQNLQLHLLVKLETSVLKLIKSQQKNMKCHNWKNLWCQIKHSTKKYEH